VMAAELTVEMSKGNPKSSLTPYRVPPTLRTLFRKSHGNLFR
jgi:hypothetical protein